MCLGVHNNDYSRPFKEWLQKCNHPSRMTQHNWRRPLAHQHRLRKRPPLHLLKQRSHRPKITRPGFPAQPTPTQATTTQETSTLRSSPGVVLLPNHPTSLAKWAATANCGRASRTTCGKANRSTCGRASRATCGKTSRADNAARAGRFRQSGLGHPLGTTAQSTGRTSGPSIARY